MFLVIPDGKLIIFFTWPYCENILPPGSPLTYFNGRGGGGGGGPRVIVLGLKFWPKVIFWVYEKCQDFSWS